MGEPSAGAEPVRTYYGRPVLKEPEWTWEVPWYLFTGGLAGASSGLALVARLAGHEVLAQRARLVSGAGVVVSPVLLILDLGRPRRFYNMLRVFKPTSAMSVGSWLLSVYATVAGTTAALSVLGRLARLRVVLDGAAGLLGLPFATYTAVLLTDSSIPVWHEARGHLPFVFAASAGASAGAASVLLAPTAEAGPARRLMLVAAAAELIAHQAMTRRLGELGRPYEEGDGGRYAGAAKACTAAGAVLVAGGRRRRWASRVGASLVLAGAVCERWAVFRAGFQSAADPTYAVAAQRRRLHEREAAASGGATGS